MSLRIEKTLNLSGLKAAPAEIAPAALTQAMEAIRVVSVERTPVETGRLAGSAAVSIEGEGGDAAAAIRYDGPY